MPVHPRLRLALTPPAPAPLRASPRTPADITEMQVKAILEAAVNVSQRGIKPFPHIMVPLVGFEEELSHQVGDWGWEGGSAGQLAGAAHPAPPCGGRPWPHWALGAAPPMHPLPCQHSSRPCCVLLPSCAAHPCLAPSPPPPTLHSSPTPPPLPRRSV